MDQNNHSINVAYDASYKSLSDIEKILNDHFLKTANDWWSRQKKRWYEYTDDMATSK